MRRKGRGGILSPLRPLSYRRLAADFMVARSKRRKQRSQASIAAPAAASVPSYVVPCALLFIGAFLLYVGSYRYPLVFDDKLINPVQLPGLATSCSTLAIRCLSYMTFGLT